MNHYDKPYDVVVLRKLVSYFEDYLVHKQYGNSYLLPLPICRIYRLPYHSQLSPGDNFSVVILVPSGVEVGSAYNASAQNENSLATCNANPVKPK